MEEYCMIPACTQGFFAKTVTVTVDYGQQKKASMFADERLKDPNGKVLKFNSVIAALNYMATQKWEFVNAYLLTVGGSKVLHYVMKRRKLTL